MYSQYNTFFAAYGRAAARLDASFEQDVERNCELAVFGSEV